MNAPVLVVEDEDKIRDLLRAYLERAGLSVITTGSGAEAIELARKVNPALVLLDLRLPDVPGEEVAREILAEQQVPILMLTAKSGEDDRIRGLEIGADDYVTKPFSPREVVLRVQAILRRGVSAATQDRTSYGNKTLVIDTATHELWVREEQVELTPTEWGILLALTNNPGRVCSRFELINRTRGYEFDGYERTVDSHVRNLRRKVELDPHHPEIIETVMGAGYKLGLKKD